MLLDDFDFDFSFDFSFIQQNTTSMEGFLEKQLESVTLRPIARVAVVQSPEAGRMGEVFVFVQPKEGSLAKAYLIFRLDISQMPQKINAQPMSELGSASSAVATLLRSLCDERFSATTELREFLCWLRQDFDAFSCEEDLSSVIATSQKVREETFADVFLPTEELEEMMSNVSQPKPSLNVSSAWLTASQLWLSTSGALEESQN